MEAKEIKDKIRNIIATSIYSNSEAGFHGYDEATNKIIKLLIDKELLKDG